MIKRLNGLMVLLFIVLMLLPLTVFAQCPKGQECPKYTNDNFKTDFANDPLAAAQNHPQEYMKYILENPSAVAENPVAYETVISQGVKYINQNKEAFKSYAQTKGVGFQAVEGNFQSFNVNNKEIKTKGASGETVASFTFDEIRGIESIGGRNFQIERSGELAYQQEGTWSNTIKGIKIRGNLKLTLGEPSGGLNLPSLDVYVSGGKISIEEKAKDWSKKIEVELNGENRARLLSSCKEAQQTGCGLAEVEIVTGTPISLSRGTLLQGKAVIINDLDIDLLPDSRYHNKLGATLSVTKQTRISPSSCSSIITYSCVEDYQRYYTSAGLISSKLIVKTVDGNQIKINAPDGAYKSIIVREIDQNLPKRKEDVYSQIGDFEGKTFYVNEEGELYSTTEKYSVDTPSFYGSPHRGSRDTLMEKIFSSQEYKNAYKIAKKEAFGIEEDSAVDLTLTKADGSKVKMEFSRDAPVSQGNLNGLQSNIGHIYSADRIPFMIYQGEPSKNTVGFSRNKLSTVFSELIGENKPEQIEFLLNIAGKLNYGEVSALLEYKDLNAGQLEKILRKYVPKESMVNDPNLDRLAILRRAASPDAKKLRQQLLNDLSSIDGKDLWFALTITDDEPRLQEVALSKIDYISDPGDALFRVSTDKLREIIIKKTDSISPDYSQEGDAVGSTARLEGYLTELKKLSPELQELALGNLNFGKGIFRQYDYNKGEAFRRVIMFYQDDPKKMEWLLNRLPIREDIGFNPELFGKVFLDQEFQEKTENTDFANKFSIALTAQRYLERSEDALNEENIKKITDLIIRQRENFAQYQILDQDTYYIPITHEEERFSNSRMVRLARNIGVNDIADINLKGAGAKDKFIELVQTSAEQGKTTIHFNNHGGPSHQWLSSGQAGTESSDELSRSGAISYVELGDALAQRGKLNEMTIMIDSCYSNDFKDNLYHYLSTVKGVQEMPVVITETNRGQVGWGSIFSNALEKAAERGKPLTGSGIYEVESTTFLKQDLSVTVPITDQNLQPYANPRTSDVIDLGSTNDAGAAEAPRKPTGKPDDKKPAELPPTVIEIAENEQEMEEKLAVG